MMSIFLIKTALLRFGVVIQGILFDVDNELVIVNYKQHGAQQTTSVPFQDIEQLFTGSAEVPPELDPRDVGH